MAKVYGDHSPGVGMTGLQAQHYRNMTEDERVEWNMMQRLKKRAQGLNDYGGRISDEEHSKAIEEYDRLKKRNEDREERARLAEVEEVRLRLEEEKQKAGINAEVRRLELETARVQIEADRVQIQKAEVVVKMLEVAQKGGVDGQQLLSAILGMSDRLLPDNNNKSAELGLLLELKKEV